MGSLTTTTRMTPTDVERLHGLVAEGDQQLRSSGVLGRDRLMLKLVARVQQSAAQPTDRALAVYVNLAVNRIFWLPEPLTARCVVQRTFATRPLITALLRTPPHVLLLVLHPACAHLYLGADGTLLVVGTREVFRGEGAASVPRDDLPGGEEAASEQTDSFLHAVDHLLGGYRADHPRPLVLGGSPPHDRPVLRPEPQPPPAGGQGAAQSGNDGVRPATGFLRGRRELSQVSTRRGVAGSARGAGLAARRRRQRDGRLLAGGAPADSLDAAGREGLREPRSPG